ncbi:hypothetical protein PHLGIDRAFT_25873 [Phlebiopsis gigantea 11061_1 CR5-6]|uniref:SET domain-containing protein n=1 Tax=Phlebiopsis gigantea (strain 11061_1 CR5-6) TaxID=745531 RepID=A0A0C3PEP0_PHLG1|nr:hypothetical protein PHLGIDRAFT_25873 [Phlebiopsis gigantea 11061_1 CR5-6]
MNSSGRGFTIGSTGSHGHGAFAARRFVRGDLILVEKPLYTVKEHARPAEVAAAVNRLSADEREHLSELANAFEQLYDDPFWGIHKTNAFAAGEDDSILCLLASRFNHSCSPNARYSWHTQSRTFRIHSLREIAPGDELLVSYISGRHVYGSTAVQRQARLKAMLGFTCACVACTQPPTAQAASDARRTELTRLWDALPLFPPHRTPARLQAVRRALELMRAEDYDADADDFANEASAMCAFHADWASVRAWALCTYRARVAEFGGDSHRAIDS